ncbi:MAG: ABC transporter ATP-binding protein [Asgard group archaeon]|nr:ABC transporter ATP-binding protein [Asgard group archaeon]
MSSEKELILEIKDLHTYFYDREDIIWKILDGVNLKIYKGETLGILGPSGSGKSVLTRSILRLVDYPGKIEKGQILFKGKDLLTIDEEIFNKIRGKEISLVLQNAPSSIDPLRDMTYTTSEPYREHIEEDLARSEIKMLVVSQLGKVALQEPLKVSDKYAHELSGGESQRVKIASAVINNPTLLIADEPVANLDATIARQILELLHQMKEKFNLTMILIAHNLGILAELSDKIAILYAGKILEYSDVDTIFYHPIHPFTQGLFYASPSIAPRGKLKPIPGKEPDARRLPPGCRFHPRCEYAIEKCKKELPELEEFKEGHSVACWRANEIPEFKRE